MRISQDGRTSFWFQHVFADGVLGPLLISQPDGTSVPQSTPFYNDGCLLPTLEQLTPEREGPGLGRTPLPQQVASSTHPAAYHMLGWGGRGVRCLSNRRHPPTQAVRGLTSITHGLPLNTWVSSQPTTNTFCIVAPKLPCLYVSPFWLGHGRSITFGRTERIGLFMFYLEI